MPSNENSLFNILTAECWYHNEMTSYIMFRPDGTGHLSFGGDIAPSFVREIDWKILNKSILEENLDITSSSGTLAAAHLSLELTITDREIQYETRTWPRDTNLLDEALLPRTFTVRLQVGRFPLPIWMDLYDWEGIKYNEAFRLRLAFDKCPYPGKTGWKKGKEDFVVRCLRHEPKLFVSRMIRERSWTNCHMN